LRISKETFSKLHYLPDPVPREDDHYKSFDELFGTDTTEVHRPSLSSLRTSKREKTLPFVASLQHVRNMDLVIQCDDCGLWRLLYSQKKLSKRDRHDLQSILEDVSFTCAVQLQNFDLPEEK